MKESLALQDVILIPSYSSVKSRADVELKSTYKGLKLLHPICVANMKTVMSLDMARAICESGGLAILHRFDTFDNRLDLYSTLANEGYSEQVAISLGINDDSYEDFWEFFLLTNCNIWCVDVAHGDSESCLKMVNFLKSHKQVGYDPLVIAGNVVTREGAAHLFENGCDIVKVGISMGSTCSTAVVSGHGRGQFTAIQEVAKLRKQYYPDRLIISDGSIQTPGDCVKALAAGADLVMIGNLFAGCVEAPGETNVIEGKMFKKYEGSSTYKNRIEGIKGWVPISGTFQDVLSNLLDGIRSGCSYSGAKNILELQINAEFEKVTNNTLTLSRPHDIKVV